MPVNPKATATPATRRAWDGAQAGDIFWTVGAGIVGSLIRHGTSSPYGHCGIIIDPWPEQDDHWLVDEAFPAFPPWKPGLRRQLRYRDTVAAVARVWRDEQERNLIVDHSLRLYRDKPPYAWSEIATIAAATVLPHRFIPMHDMTRAVICSNHVAQCIQAARPGDYELYFRYPPNLEWPGGCFTDLQALLWSDTHQ